MKKVFFLVLAMGVVIAFAQSGFAQAQKMAGSDAQPANGVKVQAEEGTATVDSVDYESRTGTLKLPDGTMVTFKAGPDMRAFDQVKVGDKVIIR